MTFPLYLTPSQLLSVLAYNADHLTGPARKARGRNRRRRSAR